MRLQQHILDLNPELVSVKEPITVGKSRYKSNLEERAANEWVQFIFEWWMYEPFSLKFPGGTYVPDFFGQLKNGGLAAIETKGWNKNLRADKLKYKASCEVHGHWLGFCWLTLEKVSGWSEKWYDRK